jgi:hypothetical protein
MAFNYQYIFYRRAKDMAVDFSKFDEAVNSDELKKEINEAPEQQFDDVPAGRYIIAIESMEVKPTKKGDKLMFSVGARIKETVEAAKKQDNRCIFFNRVISGNRTTDKWNDGRAIKGVLTWLSELVDREVEFVSYSQFAAEVESIFNDEVEDAIEIEIEYDPEAFNPISIVEVFEV